MSDVGSARKVRDQLRAAIGSEPWCLGLGVEREDGIGFVVRVNVRASADAEARARIPKRVGETVILVSEREG